MGIIKAGIYELPSNTNREGTINFNFFTHHDDNWGGGGTCFTQLEAVYATYYELRCSVHDYRRRELEPIIIVSEDQKISDDECRLWRKIKAVKITPTLKKTDGVWRKCKAFKKINGEWKDMDKYAAATVKGTFSSKIYNSSSNITLRYQTPSGFKTWRLGLVNRVDIDDIVVGSILHVETERVTIGFCTGESQKTYPLYHDDDMFCFSIVVPNENFTLVLQ